MSNVNRIQYKLSGASPIFDVDIGVFDQLADTYAEPAIGEWFGDLDTDQIQYALKFNDLTEISGLLLPPHLATPAIQYGLEISKRDANVSVPTDGLPDLVYSRITADWNPATVNWTTKPTMSAAYASKSVEWANGGDVGKAIILDITDLVNDWIDATYPNYGMMIYLDIAPFLPPTFGFAQNDKLQTIGETPVSQDMGLVVDYVPNNQGHPVADAMWGTKANA